MTAVGSGTCIKSTLQSINPCLDIRKPGCIARELNDVSNVELRSMSRLIHGTTVKTADGAERLIGYLAPLNEMRDDVAAHIRTIVARGNVPDHIPVTDVYTEQQIHDSGNRRQVCLRDVLSRIGCAHEYDAIANTVEIGARNVVDACRLIALADENPAVQAEKDKLRDAVLSYLKSAKGNYDGGMSAFNDSSGARSKLYAQSKALLQALGGREAVTELQLRDLRPALLQRTSELYPGVCARQLMDRMTEALKCSAVDIHIGQVAYKGKGDDLAFLQTAEMLPKLLLDPGAAKSPVNDAAQQSPRDLPKSTPIPNGMGNVPYSPANHGNIDSSYRSNGDRNNATLTANPTFTLNGLGDFAEVMFRNIRGMQADRRAQQDDDTPTRQTSPAPVLSMGSVEVEEVIDDEVTSIQSGTDAGLPPPPPPPMPRGMSPFGQNRDRHRAGMLEFQNELARRVALRTPSERNGDGELKSTTPPRETDEDALVTSSAAARGGEQDSPPAHRTGATGLRRTLAPGTHHLYTFDTRPEQVRRAEREERQASVLRSIQERASRAAG